jgi:small-conductance mechanosensitive channel/CRP-like cAMP-binding protein
MRGGAGVRGCYSSAPMPELLAHVHVSWGGFLATLAILVGLLFARRLLPVDRRQRGRVALACLALSLALRILAAGLMEAGLRDGAGVAELLALLLQAFGITGVLALVLFDLGFARVGVPVPSLVRDILVGVALLVISLGVLQTAGVNVTGVITTSAVLTAVVGLALQSTISNLFAGLALQVDRTLGVGDWVQVGTRVGKIVEIKWRSTLLVTRDGDNVIMPNAVLLAGEVQNFSKPTAEHRVSLKLGVSYRHPPNLVRRLLLDVARGVPGVLASPEPDCFPSEFGDSALVYTLRYWIDSVPREAAIAGELRSRIWYAAERAAVELPFPTRTVHLVTEATGSAERELVERGAELAKMELFAVLEPAERELVARDLRVERYAAGEQIIHQGDPGSSLYLVHSGEVAVRLSAAGGEREVATLGAGQFFGEMSLVTGEPRTATVAAKVDTICYVVDHDLFARVLAARRGVAEIVSAALSERQSALEGEREHLSAEARARRAEENRSQLLARIRDFFNLG